MAQNTPKQEAAQDVAPETANAGEVAPDVAQGRLRADQQAAHAAGNSEGADNALAPENQETDEPTEMPDSDLPPEISPGQMGAPRAQLMLLLGLDATHPFDAEVEAKLREVLPDYDGTVTKEMWRKLHRQDHLVSGSKE
jgi:hypothetical protein